MSAATPRWRDDRQGYFRAKNAERVALAKRVGICTACNFDPAAKGKTKCKGCLAAQSAVARFAWSQRKAA